MGPARNMASVDIASSGTLARLSVAIGLPGSALPTVLALLLGWLVMYVPTYHGLALDVWKNDEQGHGPIILALSAWMLFRNRQAIADAPRRPMPKLACLLFVLACAMYVFGRAQYIWILEASSQIPMLASMLLFFHGPKALRKAWFTLFFLVFMVPLPGDVVAAVTAPLKSAVSVVAAGLLYQFGYPVGRSGVILTVGPYQLLVADACAGLNSMFTLEALGMLYMNLMNYTAVARNVVLAILIIPISFVANIVRVMILVLVTYHFGDEAGQGFVHGFAGMVLFMVALTLILLVDGIVGRFLPSQRK
jgi:exosortase B